MLDFLEIPKDLLKEKILHYIEEDLGFGDSTSNLIPNKDEVVEAKIFLREEGIVSGVAEAAIVFEIFNCEIIKKAKDGKQFPIDQEILHVKGRARDILQAERLSLNFLMKMSGISTFTSKLQSLVNKHSKKTKVACTRKTTPGFRFFEKKAVLLGGGDTHRLNLSDSLMIKNNHVTIAGDLIKLIKEVKSKKSFSHKLEVEVKNLKEAEMVLKEGVDIIMLDNFTPADGKKALAHLKKLNLLDNIVVEFSGGIDESNIEAYAKLKPDIISLGALTHSYKALNLNLRIS